MKIRLTNLYRNISPKMKLERRIDTLASIVGRNKLVAPAKSSIDDVIETAKTKQLKYRVFY